MKIKIMECPFEVKELIQEAGQEINIEIREAEEEQTVFISCYPQAEKGFLLQKDKRNVVIRYGKLSDVGRALFLLAARQSEEYLVIQQQSSFDEFGLTLDCSRNAVPKPSLVKQMIRLAVLMGYDLIGLYIEDTMQVEGEPYYGYMRGAYTKEELKEIDSYGQKMGIEVRPYLETLAHINQITRYSDYESMIDTDDILLVGEERTYDLIEHILSTVEECFHTKKINIGMDEAHMLGRGKYLDQNGYKKRSDIMLSHLNRVLEICHAHGFTAQMWSDMFFNLPYVNQNSTKENKIEQVTIPTGVELVYWDYYATDKKHYDAMFQKHAALSERGNNFAGGAWKWTGYAPSNHFSIEAGKAALASAIEHKVKSCIITGWGDNGADASHLSTLPCLFADSELNYQGQIQEQYFETLTGISYSSYLTLDAPRYFGQDKVHSNAEKYLLFNDPLYGMFDSVIPENIAVFYQNKVQELQDVACVAGKYKYLFDTLEKLCEVLRYKAALGIEIRAAYQEKNKVQMKSIMTEIDVILEKLEQFEDALENQWQIENKAFGLEVQIIRLGGLHQRLLYTKKRLQKYLADEIQQIDELEVEQLEMGMDTQKDIAKLDYNLWSRIVSPAVL